MAPPSATMAGMNDAAANGGPPPSTLAAQLVGNISTSARSSRPDETSELKRLFEAIETVKNDPDHLKTLAERVEHNHTLIYVYARVVLEGLKWDDPFADRERMKEEALKAIQFLKVTIQETPTVVNYATDGKTFLYRGEEPLWVWLFPKLLRMLGHPQCLALSDSLQSFFHFVLDVASRSGGLWNSCGLMYSYLQANLRCEALLFLRQRCTTSNPATAILAHLKYNDPASRTTIDLELPEDTVLGTVLPGSGGTNRVRTCSYSVAGIENLNRHAACLINILHTTSVSQMNPEQQIVSFNEHVPWLVDSLEELNEEQKRWRHHCHYTPCTSLNLTLSLARSSSLLNDLVSQKLYTVIVLIATDVAEYSDELIGTGQNAKSASKTLALSLAHLAGAVIRKRPIAKLVAAKLLKSLESLSVERGIPEATGDLAVRRPSFTLVYVSNSCYLAFHSTSSRGCKPTYQLLIQRRSCTKCVRRLGNTFEGEDNRAEIFYSHQQ